MTAFGFPTENWARTGTVTASAEVAGLGAGQVQNDQGSNATAWQTPSGVTSASLTIDAGASQNWRAFLLARANLTTAATVRWRVTNDVTFATSVYDSGVISAGVVAGYGQSILFLSANQAGRYGRVDIDDPTNPERLLRIPLVFAGPVRTPARRFAVAATFFARTPTAPAVVTRGGQEFPDFRTARRSWLVQLPLLTAAESWSLAQELQRVSETGSNVLFLPYLASANAAQEAVFGRVIEPSPVTFPGGFQRVRAWSATIAERL